MIENCCVYLPTTDIDLQHMFPEGSGDDQRYEYDAGDGRVVLHISYAKDDLEHLKGFKAYVAQLENTERQKQRAYELIDEVKMILGVGLPGPVSPDSDMFQSILFLADQAGGFVFVADSIWTPDGFLVGPMTYPEKHMEPAATVEIDLDELERERGEAPPHLVAMRDQNRAALAEKGFECADWLPLVRNDGVLRPAEEIAGRLFALAALFTWVVDTSGRTPRETLNGFLNRNRLATYFTAKERDILKMKREKANKEYADTIGWKLENMWALAWALGFDPEPPFSVGQLPHEVTRSIFDFVPGLEDGTIESFLADSTARSAKEVVAKEDLFYCAHNAVRSAQLGRPTVPPEFHSVGDGGAIHERRHSLTWCLSPGVDWDDTDLST